jgi:hypothetical protein
VSAPSAKPLFRAISGQRREVSSPLFGDLPDQVKPDQRDPLDFDPTPPDAVTAFLREEIGHIRRHGDRMWEPCVGAGHVASVCQLWDLHVAASDIVDRGWPGTRVESFFDVAEARAPIQITNPPYNQINSRDGHGRWLRHSLDLGQTYIALLLNADWAAARQNGFDALFRDHPPSVEYLCCWKIDFRGGGSPPQRNSWFVWDSNRLAAGPNEWIRRRLYRDAPDGNQVIMHLEFDT